MKEPTKLVIREMKELELLESQDSDSHAVVLHCIDQNKNDVQVEMPADDALFLHAMIFLMVKQRPKLQERFSKVCEQRRIRGLLAN